MAMATFGSAQGAVDSLLGILGSVIREETQLLGYIRGDVQFIKDEMESMNGFLLHVGETSEDEDHQLCAWMRQIRDVAIESERWVDRYQRLAGKAPNGGGFLGYLRQVTHSVLTISERREVATKIGELKARAQEIGERRNRYGVEVPPKRKRTFQDLQDGRGRGDETEEQQNTRRRCLEDIPKEENILLGYFAGRLTKTGDGIPRLIRVHRIGNLGKASLRSKLILDDSIATHFTRILWITVDMGSNEWDIVKQLLSALEAQDGEQHQLQDIGRGTWDEVLGRLHQKRFLIFLDGIDRDTWETLEGNLKSVCTRGSAIIVIAKDHSLVQPSSSTYRSLDGVADTVEIYLRRAAALIQEPHRDEKAGVLKIIMTKLAANSFCSDILLQLLYVRPDRALEQLGDLNDSLQFGGGEWDNTRQMLLFCYNDLPAVYRTCLMYLSIYPQSLGGVRRTCLVRRWLADGLITRRAGLSADDAAERCVSALLDRGLLRCIGRGAAGKAKFIMVPDPVLQFIGETAGSENFIDMNLPLDLAHRISIGSGIQMQQVPRERRRSWFDILRHMLNSGFGVRWRITNCDRPGPKPSWDNIIALLESLPTIERRGLLKVLDLQSLGSHPLPTYCIKNICQISELRYLNLRRTVVTELPEEISRLQNLETLDIRETKVTVLPANIIYLLKLKHLLTGSTKYWYMEDPMKDFLASQSTKYWRVEDVPNLEAVGMPEGIGNMMELQILSQVHVSCDSDRLIINYDDIVRLKKLRKFGVVLSGQSES
ncbi:hypothetical protein VPH35_093407 [Triticum aestivum]